MKSLIEETGKAHLLFLCFAAFSGILLLYSTPFGLDISSGDSVSFIEGAKNILSGNGFSAQFAPGVLRPITHFPPFYSLMVAGLGLFFSDIYESARWCNALCFAGSVWCVCIILFRATRFRVAPSLLGGALFAANPVIFKLIGEPFSEAPFLFLGLAGQLLLLEYFCSERPLLFVMSAICFGLTVATRYSGVPWLPVGCLAVLWFSRGSWRGKMRKGAIFGVISFLPFLTVCLRNRAMGGSATNRSAGVHLISINHLQDALTTIGTWFLPWRFCRWESGLLLSALLLVGVILLGRASYRSLTAESAEREKARLVLLSSTFIGVYFLQLIVSISILDFSTPLDARILSPVEVCAILLLSVSVRFSIRTKILSTCVTFICVGLLASSALRVIPMLGAKRLSSGGYRNPKWKYDPIVKYLEAFPQGRAIYSNKPEAIWILVGRGAQPVPVKFDRMSLKQNQNVQRDFAEMAERLRSGQGILVYFPPPTKDTMYKGNESVGVPLSRIHQFSLEELKSKVALAEVVSSPQGMVLQLEK